MENEKTPPDSNNEELSPNHSENTNNVEISGPGSIGIGKGVSHSNIFSGKGNIAGDHNNIIINNSYQSALSQSSKLVSKNYPEKISIDDEAIQNINIYLEAVHKVIESGLFSDKDKNEFNSVTTAVHTLEIAQLNSSLQEIAFHAKSLFNTCKRELSKKKALQLLDDKSLKCFDQYLDILNILQMDLEDANELVDWLDANRKRMAKKYGREAISHFPDIASQTSQNTIKAFCFSVNQFLEQIAHCLRWGRPNILDNPDIPLELDVSIYIEAIKLAREDLPTYISKEAKSQFNEYMDYLLEKLLTYD